jgi:hypothetical protein
MGGQPCPKTAIINKKTAKEKEKRSEKKLEVNIQ